MKSYYLLFQYFQIVLWIVLKKQKQMCAEKTSVFPEGAWA